MKTGLIECDVTYRKWLIEVKLVAFFCCDRDADMLESVSTDCSELGFYGNLSHH